MLAICTIIATPERAMRDRFAVQFCADLARSTLSMGRRSGRSSRSVALLATHNPNQRCSQPAVYAQPPHATVRVHSFTLDDPRSIASACFRPLLRQARDARPTLRRELRTAAMRTFRNPCRWGKAASWRGPCRKCLPPRRSSGRGSRCDFSGGHLREANARCGNSPR